MLVSSYKAGHPNEVHWTKILTWRANGDGINPCGNTLIEDCFLRTQDDSLYVNGLGIRRVVLGEPQILWGQADARIRNLTFENLIVAGKPVRNSEFFRTNEFVDGLVFAPSTGSKP